MPACSTATAVEPPPAAGQAVRRLRIDKDLRSRAAGRAAPTVVRFPHSRWNEVREDELTASRLRGSYEVPRRRRRLVCEEKEKEPVRPLSGASGVRGADSAEGISARREEISAAGTGNVSDDAVWILRRGGCPAAERFPRESVGRSRAKRSWHPFRNRVVNGLQNTWHASATCVYRNWLQYMASQRAEGCRVRSRDGFPRPASAKTRPPRSKTRDSKICRPDSASIRYDDLKNMHVDQISANGVPFASAMLSGPGRSVRPTSLPWWKQAAPGPMGSWRLQFRKLRPGSAVPACARATA